MKKVLTAVAATGLTATVALAGASATFDFGTAHVFRGATVVDEFVFQPSAEITGFGMPEEYGEIAFGAWGSVAPFGDVGVDNFYETDWYLTYTLPQFVEDLDFWVGYTAYQYVFGQEKEINLGASYLLGGFGIGSTLNFMTDATGTGTEDQVYWDLFADYAFDIGEKVDIDVYGLLGIIVSQGDVNDVVLDAGFNHYELGANATYDLSEAWGLGLGLAYIGQGDSDVLPDAFYDKGLILTFGVGYEM